MMLRATLRRVVFEDVRRARATLPTSTTAIRRSLVRILDRTSLCSIATVTPAGAPYINTAYFCCSPDLVLYFLSHPNANHCRYVTGNPSASISVFSSDQPWGTPSVGVQLFGVCRRATGRWAAEAERLYATRFPAYATWRTRGAATGPGAEYKFYRIVVRSMKLLDEKTIADGVYTCATIARRRSGRTR